jgi:hypothetical protein
MDRFDGREALERFFVDGHVVNEEQIPAWAFEITKQITILNERLPNHIDWTERNIKDHEFRLREIEQSNVKDHETRIRQVEKFIWVAMGASATVGGTVGSVLTQFMK